jgi:hypothetical protein
MKALRSTLDCCAVYTNCLASCQESAKLCLFDVPLYRWLPAKSVSLMRTASLISEQADFVAGSAF